MASYPTESARRHADVFGVVLKDHAIVDPIGTFLGPKPRSWDIVGPWELGCKMRREDLTGGVKNTHTGLLMKHDETNSVPKKSKLFCCSD